jgi:DNA-binding NtrC family response regulator
MDGAHTILLVEDDDATRTFLADNLTADGFDMLVADCVRDGRRLLEAKFPDLAVVDVMLPDACGLELVREVRAADGVASRWTPTRRCSCCRGAARSSTGCAGSSAGPTTM